MSETLLFEELLGEISNPEYKEKANDFLLRFMQAAKYLRKAHDLSLDDLLHGKYSVVHSKSMQPNVEYDRFRELGKKLDFLGKLDEIPLPVLNNRSSKDETPKLYINGNPIAEECAWLVYHILALQHSFSVSLIEYYIAACVEVIFGKGVMSVPQYIKKHISGTEICINGTMASLTAHIPKKVFDEDDGGGYDDTTILELWSIKDHQKLFHNMEYLRVNLESHLYAFNAGWFIQSPELAVKCDAADNDFKLFYCRVVRQLLIGPLEQALTQWLKSEGLDIRVYADDYYPVGDIVYRPMGVDYNKEVFSQEFIDESRLNLVLQKWQSDEVTIDDTPFVVSFTTFHTKSEETESTPQEDTPHSHVIDPDDSSHLF
jgi:hypothetical protein